MKESGSGNGEQPRTAQVQPRLWRRPRRWLGLHLRRTFIAGALLLIPVALTYLILVFIYDLVNGVLQPTVEWAFERAGREEWAFPGVGLAAAVILIYLAGVVVARGLGIGLVRWIQDAVLRVPMLGTVYSASRQFIEAFSGAKMTGFQRVVMIQYPRTGSWAIGFLTAITANEAGERFAVVYIPTAPLPNSGWVAIIPFDQIYDTDMTAQAAMRFVFSGGIASPEVIKTTKAPEAS